MILLLAFAFLAGIVTILSPCILPILPIILTSTLGGREIGKSRPIGVVLGFILSFTFFTLFLSTLVRATGVSADFLRLLSIVIIATFGVSLLLPQFQVLMERLFSRLSALMPQGQQRTGFGGGLVIGLSLGLLWTPCVGPILASVISLALTGTVTLDAFLITLFYSMGTAIPMFLIMLGGQNAIRRVPWLLANTEKIQKIFGVLMLLTAIGIFFNIDRRFQTYVLNVFPNYGTGLTQIEDNDAVKGELQNFKESKNQSKSDGLLNLIPQKAKEAMLFNVTPQPAPDFVGITKWVNPEKSLTIADLKGKVVLVDFWTYTCINCIRTLPFVTSWYDKYKDQGFVVVGVHTPEFEIEKNTENVLDAIRRFNIHYPVAQDNDYATWNAYDNHYWPAEYLIDATGKVRRVHFGEGEYDTMEQAIQALLKEAGSTSVTSSTIDMPDQTPKSRISPETYLGARRMEYYYPQGSLPVGQMQSYTLDQNLTQDRFSFGGNWMVGDEYSTAGSEASLLYHFYSEHVFLVMGPGKGRKNTVSVYLDGKKVTAEISGEDVKDGIVTLDSDRLYDLINLHGNPGEHILKLEFSSGIRVFAFTFG